MAVSDADLAELGSVALLGRCWLRCVDAATVAATEVSATANAFRKKAGNE